MTTTMSWKACHIWWGDIIYGAREGEVEMTRPLIKSGNEMAHICINLEFAFDHFFCLQKRFSDVLKTNMKTHC